MDTIQSKLSTLRIEGNIAVLTIENGKKNLLTEPEFIEKKVLTDFVEAHPELMGLIITGAGRHFSHGADVSRFTPGGDISFISKELEAARDLLRTIEKLPIVTVAAVNGGCFGGGLEVALSCQFRICSKKALLGLPEVMHGVVPGMGGMERLARLLGREKAISMIMAGEMISASKALEMGLADSVTEGDCLEESVKFINELTEGKNVTQIHAIINTINSAFDGTVDPSKGKFEEVLMASWEKADE